MTTDEAIQKMMDCKSKEEFDQAANELLINFLQVQDDCLLILSSIAIVAMENKRRCAELYMDYAEVRDKKMKDKLLHEIRVLNNYRDSADAVAKECANLPGLELDQATSIVPK